MFAKVKFLCLNILIIFGSITSIQGNCRIYLPDQSTTPNLYRIVGSHKIKLNDRANSLNYIDLYENQEIEAQCDVQFERPKRYQTSNQLYIKCNGYIYIKTAESRSYKINEYNSEISLECSSIKWKLYESTKKFTWCPTNVTSYMLARHKALGHDYLAGICYDIYKQSFSSLYYTLAPKHYEYAHPSVFGNFYTPSLEIQYIKETFGSNSIINFDNQQFENWITNSNYKYSSVMQHPNLYTSFNLQFSSLLEFVWWPNLRIYNWKSYETALEQHVESENQAYDILAGVSGAIKTPIIDKCQTNYTLKEVIYGTEQKIPLYVWNYLQARDNSSNGIVIIGFNSPFQEFYSEEEIVFCPDKCQEIPWLKKFSSTFRYGIMGTVFCCNVEDVKSSKYLDGFPENVMIPKPAETTTSYILNHEPITEQNNSYNNDNGDNSDEYIADEEE
ncbi:uncharacterized protein LOC135951218 [Calliphora vicina]|uniref:uncharacterized protein LOC135951218 n=1 Tax=Calliphora vicina TaxID=7373 RepID=UPI00325B5B53